MSTVEMGPMDLDRQVNLTVEDGYRSLIDSSIPVCCTNATTPSFDHLPPDLEDSTKLIGVQIILIVAYCTIILLGVIGNSLVIYVVFKFKTLRTVTNFFIANLAVADLLVNTLCLPFTLIYTLLGEWKLDNVLCLSMVPYAQGLAVHVSTVTLTVIALDRHRCIVYHFETKMSKETCFIVIGITWMISAVLASPLAIFREYGTFHISPDKSIQFCTEKWSDNNRDGTVYSISMLLLQYVLPLSIISFAYIRIWSKLKNHVSPGEGNVRHHRRTKTTKMLVTVVVVFAVSWLPFHAFQLCIDIDNNVLDMKNFKLVYTIFHVIAMCSTFANPFLYGWMNNNYRNAFINVFKCEQKVDSIHLEGQVEFNTKKKTLEAEDIANANGHSTKRHPTNV
ncbi:neuropeptide Y receptor type 2-like [Polyodon spathula]|uniref:neuropeptide Y receptor type 2-like n=1 Tax=Polyodon spathula TaxID=7913 RepID=UPI001B7F36CC|nr:neuropeptide Y receptor type 2-like [Polyodon spathula]